MTSGASASEQYFAVSLAFCLADMPNSSEFTALFDRYRFKRVDLEIVPLANMSAVAPYGAVANGSVAVMIHSALDYDDRAAVAATEAGIDALRQMATYRMTNGVSNSPLRLTVVPRVALGAYASSVFTSYANFPAPWVDCASSGVEHYGIKLVFELVNPSGDVHYVNYKIRATYHVEFKDVV